VTPRQATGRRAAGRQAAGRQAVTVSGISVELSNAGKVLFPDPEITKGELVDYYRGMAARMLPYLKDRPLVMERYPDGVTGERIVQKNVPRYFPEWITRTRVKKQEGTLLQVICDKPATLVYLANQACVEMHAFLSRTSALECPDQLVFDLDPPDDNHFPVVRHLALRLRELLEDELGLTAFVKTTGGRGLHVHVPLSARDDFDAARRFARQASEVVAAREPDSLTVEQRRDSRGGRVYSDIMRNAYAQTVVAPYSVRARPGAPVSTPLRWEELEDSGLTPHQFTLRTVGERLARAGHSDPWAGLARRRYSLARAAQRLEKIAAR
jgi:bifunctional non-homologous end joining protein LigD